MSYKIIFFDFDGVLNSDQYMRTDAYKKETKGLSDAEVMLIAHHTHIDPEALKLINKLVAKTRAKVVASTTWRIKYSVEELTKMCQERGGTFTIEDKTPRIHGRFSEHIPRGKEIQSYLDSLSEKPEAFVIIDDCNDMIHLSKYLVQTDMEFGFQEHHIDWAVRILNEKNI